MRELAIRADNLSKRYHIGKLRQQNDRLGDQLVGFLISPFRRAGKIIRGQITSASELEQQIWALDNVSFEIKQGDVVGIIGHNGAGKSTLLKILSRITEPTRGYADIYGRVSSLLEVGTGFHPELTGRENIFLNGAILGMRKREIESKFEEIVEFAEIGQFIDTPVKHYSSGMYVRLAFSVAAHLEPEILLVDEVLAVGDVNFQKKCLGKMDDVSRRGRTVIFVSHNMNAIRRLCPRSMLFDHGQLAAFGNTEEVIEQYLSSSSTVAGPDTWIDLSDTGRRGNGKVRFAAVSYRSPIKATGYQPASREPLEVSLDLLSDFPRSIGSIAVTLRDRYGAKLVNADLRSLGELIPLKQGHNILRVRINELYLNPGIYTLGLYAADPPSELYDAIPSAVVLEVVELESDKMRVRDDGMVPCDFELLEIS